MDIEIEIWMSNSEQPVCFNWPSKIFPARQLFPFIIWWAKSRQYDNLKDPVVIFMEHIIVSDDDR